MRVIYAIAICLAIQVAVRGADAVPRRDVKDDSLSMVVMDPLAEPLSCPCVKGYAQRKYDKLADYLSAELGRPVHVTFAESFEKALAKPDCKTIHIAIGKDGVVRADAAGAKLKVMPVARLTGQDGLTTQTGLIVVRSADVAQRVEDLQGYRILFGPRECEEKFAAPRKLLQKAGIKIPSVVDAETTESCSDGACKIIEWGASQRAAAVISSYAAPLLQGCGTVKKGDLRVIAETKPVPFITAFTTDRIDREMRAKVQHALLHAAKRPDLLTALETLAGFVEIDDAYRAAHDVADAPRDKARPAEKEAAGDAIKSKRTPQSVTPAAEESSDTGWPQWRGPT